MIAIDRFRRSPSTVFGDRLAPFSAIAIGRPPHVDGYFHHEGGWAEAGQVVEDLVAQARAAGVIVREGVGVTRIVDDGVLAGDQRIAADDVVACTGAWTPSLVPGLSAAFRTVGQPVFHLRPDDPSLFAASRFPVFGADISRTGYYGFPIHEGVLKIANHGRGVAMSPDDARAVPPVLIGELERFVHETLAPATLVRAHLCVYGDTLDGHFWIDRAPSQPKLLVAAGGSGHAFKFAPVLGGLIADALDGDLHPRFRSRTLATPTRGDAARS